VAAAPKRNGGKILGAGLGGDESPRAKTDPNDNFWLYTEATGG
jgi:hypothetical protein